MKVQKGGLIVLFLSIFMFIRCDHFPLVEPNDNYDFITFRNNSDDTYYMITGLREAQGQIENVQDNDIVITKD